MKKKYILGDGRKSNNENEIKRIKMQRSFQKRKKNNEV